MTAGMLSLYPSISHEADLRELRESLDKRDEKTIVMEELLKMREYMFKNSYYKWANKIKGMISETAMSTKFSSQYPYILTNNIETKFREVQHLQPLV